MILLSLIKENRVEIKPIIVGVPATIESILFVPSRGKCLHVSALQNRSVWMQFIGGLIYSIATMQLYPNYLQHYLVIWSLQILVYFKTPIV
jgi:hypothetical protein